MAEHLLPTPLKATQSGSFGYNLCVCCGEETNSLYCLLCLHSVSACEKTECQQKLIGHSASCPHCKEHFIAPAEGFQSPRYYFAERKAAAKKIEEEGTFCCAEHSTPQVAVVFCSDCPGPLCEECHSPHRSVAILKKHRIFSLEDPMKAGLIIQHRPLLCPAHKKELECFCQDCEVLICTVCPVVGPHQSHSVLFVDEEVGDRNRQPLEQCIRSAEKRIEEMSSAVRYVDSRLLTLHEEGNRCKEDIAGLKQHMIEAVNRRCAILVAEVEEAEEKKRRDLEQHKKALEAQKNQLELFMTSATDIVQEGTTREQLSLRQSVIQRVSSLTSIPPPPAPSSSSSVFFVPEKKEEAEKILSVMGRVSLGPTPEASSIYIEGLFVVDNTVECRPWGLPLSIRVVSTDCRGIECDRGGERVESVLTPTSCGVPVQGEVKDRGDGTYQVTFKCLPSEECRLSVTVNGSDIRGSPVRVKLNDPSIIKQEINDREGRRFIAIVYTKEGTLLAADSASGTVCCFDLQSGELLHSFKVLVPDVFGEYEEAYKEEDVYSSQEDAEGEGSDVNEHDALEIGDIAVLSDGNIAVSVCYSNCVAVYRPNGERIMEFGSDRLKEPCGLAVNRRGQLFVADECNNSVCVFTENGEFQYSFKFGSKGEDPGQFSSPEEMKIAQDGLVYVSDSGNNRIQVFQQDGRFVQQFGQDVLDNPGGLAFTKDGHIVVTSYYADKLSIFTQSGECVHEIREIGLDGPIGVAIADDGSILVADSENYRIVKL